MARIYNEGKSRKLIDQELKVKEQKLLDKSIYCKLRKNNAYCKQEHMVLTLMKQLYGDNILIVDRKADDAPSFNGLNTKYYAHEFNLIFPKLMDSKGEYLDFEAFSELEEEEIKKI